MEVTAKVIGVRLWERGNEGVGIRHVTLEWIMDDKTEKNPYPTHFTLDIKDIDKEFDLGDEVIVRFTKVDVKTLVE